MISKLIIVIYFFNILAFANQEKDLQIDAVNKYLQNNNLEQFKNIKYQIKVIDVAVGDLNNDGNKEVIIAIKPHYLQSPSIIIFQVNNKMHVTKVIEGLAPGNIKLISGDFIDSHTIGEGVDIIIKPEKTNIDKNIIIQNIIQVFNGVVEYQEWVHVDKRKNKMYIDMKHINFPNKNNNCEKFEFATIKYIKIIKIKERNFLLAHVDNLIYIYRIDSFLKNGLIDKNLQIIDANSLNN